MTKNDCLLLYLFICLLKIIANNVLITGITNAVNDAFSVPIEIFKFISFISVRIFFNDVINSLSIFALFSIIFVCCSFIFYLTF